jgi:ABC-type antimicrobial peptide transport system permease subunit
VSLLHGHLKQALRRLGRAPLFGAIILVTVAIGEIGIRMALGAQRTALTRMYVREGLILTGMGVLCGISVAFATMRLMSSLLYHVSPMDPWTYVAATLSIIAIAWIATYVPSRRAAVVDPVHALRAE